MTFRILVSQKTWLLAVAVVIFVGAGCSKKKRKVDPDPKPAQSKRDAPIKDSPVTLSPEEQAIQTAFTGFSGALQAQDWGGVYQALSSESQQQLLGAFVIGASWRARQLGKETEFQSLSAQLELSAEMLQQLPQTPQELDKERVRLTELAPQLAEAVNEPQAGFVAVASWLSKAIPVDERGQFEMFSPGALDGAKLTSVKVSGDSAQATLVIGDEGPNRSVRSLAFVLQDNRWVLDLLKTDPVRAPKKPAP